MPRRCIAWPIKGARSIQIPNFPSELGMPDYHDDRYDPALARLRGDRASSIANHLSVRKESLYDIFRRDPTPTEGHLHRPWRAFPVAETLQWYILTGILERHPKLRVVFVEPGLFWLPGLHPRARQSHAPPLRLPGRKGAPLHLLEAPDGGHLRPRARGRGDAPRARHRQRALVHRLPASRCATGPTRARRSRSSSQGVPEEEVNVPSPGRMAPACTASSSRIPQSDCEEVIMAGVLDGIRVLDLSWGIAGPIDDDAAHRPRRAG